MSAPLLFDCATIKTGPFVMRFTDANGREGPTISCARGLFEVWVPGGTKIYSDGHLPYAIVEAVHWQPSATEATP